jgi:hypothetical protein
MLGQPFAYLLYGFCVLVMILGRSIAAYRARVGDRPLSASRLPLM